MKSELKAGYTRWYTIPGFTKVLILQVIARKYKKTGTNGWLVRDELTGERIYRESTILHWTYPTYRKALRSVCK